MNTSQEQLQSLLTIAIHGGVPSSHSFSTVNGEELFYLAFQQKVFSIIYPILNKYRDEIKLDDKILRRWKDATLYTGVGQIKMISDIKIILKLFETNGIQAISVKGLVLKQLYIQPELRNMSDIDLLIHEKDMERSMELLSNFGYYPCSKDLNNPSYMHIKMKKTGSFSIELHRTLWAMRMKPINDGIWLSHIWENKRLTEIEGFQFTALALEDEFINLIVHLARHLMVSGAQLRQLCDFVLFIKTYWDMLDLHYIEKTIKLMNLYAFYNYLLLTSCQFLGLKLPVNGFFLDENKSKTLINLIYNSSKHYKSSGKSRYYSLPLKLCRVYVKKVKDIGLNFAFFSKILELIKRFSSRHRSLRSIGLNMRG